MIKRQTFEFLPDSRGRIRTSEDGDTPIYHASLSTRDELTAWFRRAMLDQVKMYDSAGTVVTARVSRIIVEMEGADAARPQIDGHIADPRLLGMLKENAAKEDPDDGFVTAVRDSNGIINRFACYAWGASAAKLAKLLGVTPGNMEHTAPPAIDGPRRRQLAEPEKP